MQLQEFYHIIGGNYKEVRTCLGNDICVKKAVFGFMQDASYEKLQESVERKDWGASISYAQMLAEHGEKVGFSVLSEACLDLLHCLEQKDSERLAPYMKNVSVSYEQIARCITYVQQDDMNLSDISYNLRTSMNTIIGFAKLLENNLDNPEKAKSYIGKIKFSGEELLDLAGTLSQKNQIDTGRIIKELDLRDLGQYFETVLEGFEQEIKRKGIKVETDLALTHPFVACDAAKLRKIGTIIIRNSLQYMGQDGCLNLSIEEIPQAVEGGRIYQFIFENDGIGLSEEQRSLFMDDNKQAYLEKQNQGVDPVLLGARVAKKLVSFLGGTFTLESNAGAGTKAVVSLPLLEVEGFTAKEQEEEIPKEQLFQGKRVLLAEDNEWNAQLAKELLVSMGFLVEVVGDGAACVTRMQKADEKEFDLILMDVRMPVLDGYETTRRIRKMGGYKGNIPVVALTANAFDEDKMEAISSGMNGYISKPVEITKLIATLSGVFRRCRR